MKASLQDLHDALDAAHANHDNDHVVVKDLLPDPAEDIFDADESFGIELSDNALACDQATPTTESIEENLVEDLLFSPAGKAVVEEFFEQSGVEEKSDC
jgi:hypothetical protein